MQTIDEKVQYRCPKIQGCAFFQKNANTMPSLADKLKQRYCFRDNKRCARLWINRELGREFLPDLLLPNQYDWAQQILCDAGKCTALYDTV